MNRPLSDPQARLQAVLIELLDSDFR